MEIRITFLLWISIIQRKHRLTGSNCTGRVDIGYPCKYDAECTAGNGGEYSKCHRKLSICICTINHLGEDKCSMPANENLNTFLRRINASMTLRKPRQCFLECSPEGTRKWREDEDWYGNIQKPFALHIPDKKTPVCYDLRRALNTVPDIIEIKQSLIPNAGLGAFTKAYIEQDTVFEPYKGILEPDSDTASVSEYSWQIVARYVEDRGVDMTVDAKYEPMSNWLRYINTPTSYSMENLEAVQYKGNIFYRAFRNIEPGSELLVWYGESYGEVLEIEKFDPPVYTHAKPEFAGGACHDDDEGTPCQFDENTVCADKTCFCLPNTHFRAGKCIKDETLGGVCSGSNGETCKQDSNAECRRGVCVCKTNTTPANGLCIADETFGGLCDAKNGESCLLDENAICVHGICRCRYGTTGINGKCLLDEVYQGRCSGENHADCENDTNAECIDNICLCKENASVINGKCQLAVDIGHACKNDMECNAGNGGSYSRCSKRLSVCICTITHLGEIVCDEEKKGFGHACKRLFLNNSDNQCPVNCSQTGARKWTENEDWYGETIRAFAGFIEDKTTSVCYDPERDMNSLPDGFVIKPSTIPGAGLGVFTEVYIEQGTMFGPYKGIVALDKDDDVFYEYSWSIQPDDVRAEYTWIHGDNKATSNWLRYINTPVSAAMENIAAIQYKGEMYYSAFKSIPPGTELLVWYGEAYRKYLKLQKFLGPDYYYGRPGYAGGKCKQRTGDVCDHDSNAICADQTCFCVRGTHYRAGICVKDETFGGICTGSNGETCKQDRHAECQNGVCVCKNNTTPFNGMCIPAEALGGLCKGDNGEDCELDINAHCVYGICRCKYGTTGFGNTCRKDEVYQGRCSAINGRSCKLDKNAICMDNICVCKNNTKAVNGVCEFV